jgi:hypothetical protein
MALPQHGAASLPSAASSSKQRADEATERCLSSAFHLPRNFVFAVGLAQARLHQKRRRLELEKESNAAQPGLRPSSAATLDATSSFEDFSSFSGPEV